MRSRKQKLMLFGFDKQKIIQKVMQIISMRYSNVFTGKGLRPRGTKIVLKKRKQQQRGK
jgi:ribosomal protein L6P/L9E